LLFHHDLDPADLTAEGERLTRRAVEAYLRERDAPDRASEGGDGDVPAPEAPSSAAASVGAAPAPASGGSWQLLEVQMPHGDCDAVAQLHNVVRALTTGAPALAGLRVKVFTADSGREAVVSDAQHLNEQGLRRQLEDGHAAGGGPVDVVVVTGLPPGVSMAPRAQDGAAVVVTIAGPVEVPLVVRTSEQVSALAIRSVCRVQLLVDTERVPLQQALAVLGRLR